MCWRDKGDCYRKICLANEVDSLLDCNPLIFYKRKWNNWFINNYYYVAVSHKDWELPKGLIWLAAIDIDRGLDFPI